ncbi:MAG: pyridoxal phosphate-dependent aminotransferase [Actinomycetota bacterium]|nr:pyridoxal phosphate-dependent aminotransferase [Actinomycetota bacterium]MED6327412.1 pyridoxal phosphate-dependent aminotransferase [Actinomycetota bacterium]MEE2958879.1 pyridoxal phosphate-dependent aminotransferase [Actinomycetota bacterium]
MVDRMQGHRLSIFGEMSALAIETGAINLGQGFPDTDGPPEVTAAAVQAIRDGFNQYPPDRGIPELRQAVADHQRRFYDLDVSADEVMVSTGASEALGATVMALVEPGQEVVVFEPYFDLYAAVIELAGGVRRAVTLRAPDYSFDPAELEAAVGPGTRLLMLNTPHNPTGKVFSRSELEVVARVAVDHDLMVVTDEVYEHMTYDGTVHLPLASLPGMAERTVTISSGGKSFGLTGWKVGWAHATDDLIRAVHTVKQHLSFTSGAPFQRAMVTALNLGDDYFTGLAEDLWAKRDLVVDGLSSIGFDVYPASGTYYVTADVRPLGYDDGMDFCRDLPGRCGVVAVPNRVFYDDEQAGRSVVRFAYCKRFEVLDEAMDRLSGLKG